MKKLTKKILWGATTGIMATALALNFAMAEPKQNKKTKTDEKIIIIGGKKADLDQYFGIDFFKGSSKEVTSTSFRDYGILTINYPNKKTPNFTISYWDLDGDKSIEEYGVTAFYHKDINSTSGKILLYFLSKEEYIKRGHYKHPSSIVEYMGDDLQKKVDSDYKKLIEEYGSKEK